MTIFCGTEKPSREERSAKGHKIQIVPEKTELGKFAYDRFSQKLDDFRREMDAWRQVGLGTDYKS